MKKYKGTMKNSYIIQNKLISSTLLGSNIFSVPITGFKTTFEQTCELTTFNYLYTEHSGPLTLKCQTQNSTLNTISVVTGQRLNLREICLTN